MDCVVIAEFKFGFFESIFVCWIVYYLLI